MITTAPHRNQRTGWSLKALVGSGDRIALFAAPFVVVGLTLNVLYPAWSAYERSVKLPWL